MLPSPPHCLSRPAIIVVWSNPQRDAIGIFASFLRWNLCGIAGLLLCSAQIQGKPPGTGSLWSRLIMACWPTPPAEPCWAARCCVVLGLHITYGADAALPAGAVGFLVWGLRLGR